METKAGWRRGGGTANHANHAKAFRWKSIACIWRRWRLTSCLWVMGERPLDGARPPKGGTTNIGGWFGREGPGKAEGAYRHLTLPNGFPSPPPVSFPTRDVRFANCGPPQVCGGEGARSRRLLMPLFPFRESSNFTSRSAEDPLLD